jgi:hypothetical protein
LSENERPQRGRTNSEELKDVLGVVSKKMPSMIKNIMRSVFSEGAGAVGNMGKTLQSRSGP